MPASYGLEVDPYATYLVRALGATNVAVGVLLFLVSGVAHSPARQAVVTFMIVHQMLSLIVNLLAALSGAAFAGAGWTGVVSNLVFALAFAYFRFVRPEASLTPGIQP